MLIELLDRRLDASIYRLGYAPTIRAARQLVGHGHVRVNNARVSIPSYQCGQNDVLVCTGQRDTYTCPPLEVNNLFVVEYYSRK
jgi:small subunit ribosomal protein S4